METRSQRKTMMTNCGQDEQAGPPPAPSPNQNKTNIVHDNPPQEAVETHRQGEDITDLQGVPNDDVLSKDNGDISEISDPKDEDSDEETINRDFIAGKRIRELNATVRNKKRQVERLLGVERQFKDAKMRWSSQKKMMEKDIRDNKKNTITMTTKYEREHMEVKSLRERLREQKKVADQAVQKANKVQRKFDTLVTKGDAEVDDKLDKMRSEVEESVKLYNDTMKRYEKMRKEKEKAQATNDLLKAKILELEKEAAIKKHEADVRKVELRKEAEEIKMEKEKVKLEASLRSDSQKAELTIKTINAKYAVAEAKKMREMERKWSEENEKRERYEQKKSKSFFSSSFTSKDPFREMRQRYDDREGSNNRMGGDRHMVSPMTPPMRHQSYHGRYHGNYMGQIFDPYNPNPYTPPYHHHPPSPYGFDPGSMGPTNYGHGGGRVHNPMRQPVFDDMMNSQSSYSSQSVGRRPVHSDDEEDKGKITSYFNPRRDM